MAPEFVPEPKDAHRTLIVLLDGTGDKDDKDATNIVLLYEMLYNGKNKKYSGNDDKQLVYYKPGIGADTTENYTGLLWNTCKNMFDKAVASSFQDHLIAAYTWLAEHYQDGDKICIFGFSRGAYTARALAGMLKGMGLLDAASVKALVVEAYTLYEKFNSLPEEKEAWSKDLYALTLEWKKFRLAHGVKMPFVEFLGCWDSVNSIGIADNIKLSYTATNNIVRTFRHALALDERRVKFKQNTWSKPSVAANTQPNEVNCPSVVTDVEEVWFAGCHCDVGGGSVLNGTRPNLAHISLRWMIRECFKARTGMIFSAAELAKLGIEPSHLYPDVRRRPDVDVVPRGTKIIRAIEAPEWGPWAKSFFTKPKAGELTLPNISEEDLDALDAFAPMYDQLVIKSTMWKVMESWSLEKPVHNDADDTWSKTSQQHNGIGRSIPPAKSTHGGKIRVHRTVRMRMQGMYENGADKGKQYIPKARVGWQDKTPFEQVDADLIEWVS
ncbi:hypothetical protein B0H19DRAFT_174288 [Mycena capillaripes]|nr:hypothetical protein B0H19DRAFT_174288 [Mycena capillaripes]